VIDPQVLRNDPEIVRASLRARGDDESIVDRVLEADATRRDAIATFENLRAEQNAHGKLVAQAPKDEKAALVAAAQDLADRVKQADKTQAEAGDAFSGLAGGIGNIIIDGVPAGGENDFVTRRYWRVPRRHPRRQ
jgi:seryl-tRNA synthetase